jgi:hypothetical protein
MKKIAIISVLAALSLLSGCIESTTLLDLKRDGSGQIVVRECFSPQITQMMEGMGGMFAGMGESEQPTEKPDIFEDMIEGNIADFGPGVELVKSKRITNKQGWKGYEATYAFKDINQLTVTIGDSDQDSAEEDAEIEEEDNNPQFTFQFSAGDPAVLKIIPAQTDEPEVEQAEASSEDAMGEQMGEDMMAGMGAMMGPMLQGMKLAFIVRVEDDIKQSNAVHRSEKHPNVVTIMYMPVDKMIGNAEAMKILQSDDKDSLARIEKMNIPGLKLEDPGKTIEIEF